MTAEVARLGDAARCSIGCSRPSTPQQSIDNSSRRLHDRAMSTNVVDALARVPMLRASTGSTSRSSSKDFSERTFPAGSVVVEEGAERGIGFFVVADGEAVASVGGTRGRPARAGQPLRRGRPDQRPGPDRHRDRCHGPPHLRDDAVGLPLVRPGRRRGRVEAPRAARRDAPPTSRPRPTGRADAPAAQRPSPKSVSFTGLPERSNVRHDADLSARARTAEPHHRTVGPEELPAPCISPSRWRPERTLPLA